MVKSAERAINILETLADVPQGLSHADLADRLAIPRSSLTGLLNVLTERNFVEWDEARRRYMAGFAVLRLGRSYLGRLDLVQCAQPLLTQLSEDIGEACALTVRRENMIVVVAKVDDPNLYRPSLSLQLGHSGPLYASATGKAMLAAEGSSAIADYIGFLDTVPADPKRKLDVTLLRTDLEIAVQTGFGWSRGEMFHDIVAVGVAVHGSTGEVVAGISVSLPHDRDMPKHLAMIQRALRDCALTVSAKMGAAA
jgi:IclR family acetate operon transcriptional repressor